MLLNKVDLVDEGAKAAVLAAIREINAGVEVIETRHCAVDLGRVLGVQAFDLDRVLQAEEDFLDTGAEHRHDESVSSVGIELAGALDLPALNKWLTRLLQERGVDIFRSKGVLHVHGSDARYVFQGVHMMMGISSSDDGVGRPWKEGEARTNRLIFIGRNLDREDIRRSFEACVAAAP